MADLSVGRAFEIAFAAHRDQKDKAGQPYIGHVARVAAGVQAPVDQIVALLHDCVEDTPVTLGTVREAFGAQVSEAVDCLTKRDGEPLDAYLRRVGSNPIARRVKLSDLRDNSDPLRLSLLDAQTREMLSEKYAYALTALSEADRAAR